MARLLIRWGMAEPIELPRSRAELERGMRLGWHTGAQLYASLRGRMVVDLAVGEARLGVPMATDTIVEWASATKPVTCSAAALLWQRGLFDLDVPPPAGVRRERQGSGDYPPPAHPQRGPERL